MAVLVLLLVCTTSSNEDYNIDRPLIRQEIVLKSLSVQVIVNFSNYPRALWLFSLQIDARESSFSLLGY
jgi:hypothetical protein